MKVLFTSDANGHEHSDPYAWLVEVPLWAIKPILKALEFTQPGATRLGGDWHYIMEKGNIPHTELSSGKKSNYKVEEYDTLYELISGNY